ncbi:HAD hydrolase family protein, partial [Corynebacterium macclintockiae]|uniref:HAD hydrolase family protein n=2 Tax=Corynebacterium TaxID=1716 RepID=UPI00254BE6C4
MTRRLMAFDLDGTILFADGIRPADAEAVARWRAAGNLAVTATGKSIAATRFALRGTGVEFDYHVLNT